MGAKLVFPNSEYLVAATAESRVDPPSPQHVQFELLSPVLTVRGRHRTLAVGAPVPETPVDENSDLFRRKHEVRESRHIARVHTPSTDPVPHQSGPKAPLGRAVAFRAHERHSVAALLGCEAVHIGASRFKR
jgi:hypothetical protein